MSDRPNIVYFVADQMRNDSLHHMGNEASITPNLDGMLEDSVSFSSSEIEEYNIQSVSWYEDGIKYLIMSWDYDDLTKDQMIDMAKQVIDK